jgi:hypothetical protein
MRHEPLWVGDFMPDRPFWVNVYQPHEVNVAKYSRTAGMSWFNRDEAASNAIPNRRLLYRVKVTPKVLP